jgi:hypothetical protein
MQVEREVFAQGPDADRLPGTRMHSPGDSELRSDHGIGNLANGSVQNGHARMARSAQK